LQMRFTTYNVSKDWWHVSGKHKPISTVERLI
jgi:hypothetical protein